MNQERASALMNDLVGYAFPSPLPVGDGTTFVRRWVLRTEKELPDQQELDRVAQQLLVEVNREIAPLADELGSSVGARAEILRISPNHCVAVIEAPAPEHANGPEAAIATWQVLRGLDKKYCVQDLEGIPRMYWKALVL